MWPKTPVSYTHLDVYKRQINTSIADNLESGMRTDLYKPKEYKLSGGRATNTARKSNASGGGDAQSRKETEAQKKEFNWIRQALDSISRTVSYTHLDVYKRQSDSHLPAQADYILYETRLPAEIYLGV